MAQSSASRGPVQELVKSLADAGKAAFDPTLESASRQTAQSKYEQFVNSTSTVALIPALNALIKPNVTPPWLREPLLRTLTHLPLRPYGVRATMEFVFSVHPSNAGRALESDEVQKQGANITHEAVAVATKLLSSVPTDMSAHDWFAGIAGQLFSLIDGQAGQDIAKTAAQVVGFGILGRKQHGAPGAPGWNAFIQPLIEAINPSLQLTRTEISEGAMADEDGVVDLSHGRIRVLSQTIQRSVQRLQTIILSNPAPGLCRRLLSPILQQIWILASWVDPPQAVETQVCSPARILFQTFLKLFGKWETISPILDHIDCKGSLPDAENGWTFRINPHQELDIVSTTQNHPNELDWSSLDVKVSKLVENIATLCSTEDVSSIFRHLLENWIQTQDNRQELDFGKSTTSQSSESPFKSLVEVTALQKLMEKTPEKLISRFDQLLDLVCQVLIADERSALADEILAVVLSLMNLIIGAPSFRKSDISEKQLDLIDRSLTKLSARDRHSVAPTARNLHMLLKYRAELDEVEESDAPRSEPDVRSREDRRMYDLAMNYITGNDNPPPVVSEGLGLLSKLIASESRILDITSVLVLMSTLLVNNEDYINLRVIRVFTQLANKHPKTTLGEILEHYLDGQEKNSTDVRLRFGEALLHTVEKLGETFAGDVAQQTGETLLSIAGRRGYRAKTHARQTREERLSKLKKQKGRDENLELDETDDEDMTEHDKANNDVLAQIVQGWESKRGSEDVRMRSSALSIFGATLETNVAGVGATLTSTGIDLCINVLTLEREPEKAILRRAAIIVVMSFVRALSDARDAGRSLGFGLTDQSRKDIVLSLQYIAATDNDGLVQQHANDVAESLENWAVMSMLPTQGNLEPAGLTRLAGLTVNPGTSSDQGPSQPAPRIEEIE